MATDHARLSSRIRLTDSLVAVFGLLLLIGAFGSIGARASYGFRAGETATVTVAQGGVCETVIRRRGGGGTDCPATWTVDGQQVCGTLTTKSGGELPEPGTDSIRATVYGDTARTDLDRFPYVAGLVGPWLALVALLGLGASYLVNRRSKAALASTPLTEADVRAREDGRAASAPRSATASASVKSSTDTRELPVGDEELRQSAQELELGRVLSVHKPVAGWRSSALFVLAMLGLAIVVGPIVLKVILVLVGLLWAAFVGFVLLRLRKAGQRTVIFEHGLADHLAGERFVARWDDLDVVWKNTATYGVRTRDGRTLVLTGAEPRMDHVTAGQLVLENANLRRLAGMRHRLSVGAELPFGPMTLTQQGLFIEGRISTWDRQPEVWTEGGQVKVRDASGTSAFPEGDVPWVQALTTLVTEQRRAARQGPAGG